MFIKRCFQREPIISTVVTAGTVNILLGMAEGQALLAFLGVLVVSGTLAGRGWHKYRYPLDLPDQSAMFSHTLAPQAIAESSQAALAPSGQPETAIASLIDPASAHWQTAEEYPQYLEDSALSETRS
ncbi:hypothetical protein [Halomicronema sp. CCY15110]|uniref:hypothetical protein n=1 Tax=Halomicronema sp. CCY15110 TaxID=2767773 RepID=UPI001950BC6C|nr:hypothetical protein [Halomicronema sp. CCY15110]